MDKQLEQLKELWTLVKQSITREEFIAAFKKVALSVQEARKDLEARIDARLSQIKNGMDGKDGKSIVGPKGDKGDKGDKGERGATFIALRGEKGESGKDGSPDTPFQVRDKLESLPEGERFRAEYIDNLKEFLEKYGVKSNGKTFAPVNHPLWALMDVDISGIIAGQSLQWSGVKWIAYTPAGSGGTPVWGESLESQAPTGTVFTLAHTPLAGTLRVFRGGAYQRVTDDYTISGATLTLVNALQSGELLTVDYSY